MSILRELLLESSNFLDKYKPLYMNISSTKMVERVKQALQKLQLAVDNKQIWNADFNDIKGDLSSALEQSLKAVLDLSRTNSEDSPHLIAYKADISYYVYLNQATGQVKKINNVLKDNKFSAEDSKKLEIAKEINQAAADVNSILTDLKPHVVKGRKPSDKPVDPNKFVSKLGSIDSQKLVMEKLQDGIKKPLDDYEDAINKWFQSVYNAIKSNLSEFIVKNPIDSMIFSKCFSGKRDNSHSVKGEYKYTDLKVIEQNKDFPEKEAKLQRENIEKQYIVKNIKKLSHIVDLKGNIHKISELPYKKATVKGGSGTLESGFKFEFADNSSFEVVNKIVVKESFRGNTFQQFPTTFHNVVFPDGSKMKSPSEEKMIKEFGNWNPV